MIRREALSQLRLHFKRHLGYIPCRGEFKNEEIVALCMMYLRDNDDGTRSRIGEDIALCNRWRMLLGEIWMDPAIVLKHIGKSVYSKSYSSWIIENQKAGDE